MSHVETLTPQDQAILLWVAEAETGVLWWTAEAETGFLVHDHVLLTDRTAFDIANARIDQLVQRGLLDRDRLGAVENGLYGCSVSLTRHGVETVVELWRERCLKETVEMRQSKVVWSC